METMTCPKCQGEMTVTHRFGIDVAQCKDCQGIFLDRGDLADLIEQENEWHLASGPHTQPLPRITADMQAPPPSPERRRAQSFIDALFG